MNRGRKYWILSAIFAFTTVFPAGGSLYPRIVEAASAKRIPSKNIPRKRIPKTRRYYQAPAFGKRAKRNRRLVLKARREGRRLRRTGTAYEDDFR